MNDGAVEALEVDIGEGLPTVGSALYNFHVADVPKVPPEVVNEMVPVLLVQIALGPGVRDVGLVLGVLTTKVAAVELTEPLILKNIAWY